MDIKRGLKKAIEDFRDLEGRQPRVMVTGKGKGVPGPEAAKIASLLADVGFNVDFGPLCADTRSLSRIAKENDVDFICLVSTQELDSIFLKQLCDLLKPKEHQNSVFILLTGAEGSYRSTFENDSCFLFVSENNLFHELLVLLTE